MFVFTMKFNKRVAISILVAIAIILGAIVLVVGLSGSSEASPKKIGISSGLKTNEDRLSYLKGLGWECEETPIEEQDIVIPREFSPVFEEYNTLQKSQGFDLSEYTGLEVKMYRYRVTNYESSDEMVVAQLMILNSQVIGGDIHSTSVDGFMHGLK